MMTIQQKMYETTVKAVGGRQGSIESDSPKLNLAISTPREMAVPAVKARILSSCSQPDIPLASTAR